MPRGGPRKAGGPSKKGSKSRVTLLTSDVELEVPPLPDPNDWIAPPHFVETPKEEEKAVIRMDTPDADIEAMWPDDPALDDIEVEWCGAVVKWWHDIWSSPMAGEFVHSDIHSLYLACYYLHESLNAYYRPSDRLAFGKQFQATIKDFGLTPSARESLRWQVAQGTMAQQRTDQVRAAASASTDRSKLSSVEDIYSQYA